MSTTDQAGTAPDRCPICDAFVPTPGKAMACLLRHVRELQGRVRALEAEVTAERGRIRRAKAILAP